MDEITYLRHTAHICLTLMNRGEDRNFLLDHYRRFDTADDQDCLMVKNGDLDIRIYNSNALLRAIGIDKGSCMSLEKSETPFGRDGTYMYTPDDAAAFNATVYRAGHRLINLIDDPMRVVRLIRPFDYSLKSDRYKFVMSHSLRVDSDESEYIPLAMIVADMTWSEFINTPIHTPTDHDETETNGEPVTIPESSTLWIAPDQANYLQVVKPDPRNTVPPGIMCDSAIRTYCGLNGDLPEGVKPLVENVQSSLKCEGVLSYGVSSYGFDARLGTEFVVFKKKPKSKKWFQFWKKDTNIVDPKDIRRIGIRRFKSTEPVVIPPHGFLLAHTKEVFNMPEDVIADVVGKSTYARCSLIVNVTPIEPGWYGQVTLEISNTSDFPALVYPGEGVCQFRFFKGAQKCETPYNARNGKYLNQTGVVLPRIMVEDKLEVRIDHGIPEFNALHEFYSRAILDALEVPSCVVDQIIAREKETNKHLGGLNTDLRKEYGNSVSADQIVDTLGDPRDSVKISSQDHGYSLDITKKPTTIGDALNLAGEMESACSTIANQVSRQANSAQDALRESWKTCKKENPKFETLKQDAQMFMVGFRALSNESNLSDGIIGQKWKLMVLDPFTRIRGHEACRLDELRQLYTELSLSISK